MKTSRLLRLPVAVLGVLLGWASAPGQSADIDDFVLLADKELSAKGLRVINGDIGVNQPKGKLKTKGALDAPSSTVIAAKVKLDRDSVCAELFAQKGKSAPGCGPTMPFSAPILDTDIEGACGFPHPFPSRGSEDVEVGKSQTLSLPPGAYDDVKVREDATLLLEGGDYVFDHLTVRRNGRLLAKAPVQVSVVRGKVELGDAARVGPDDGALMSPCEFRFFLDGDDKLDIEPRSRLEGRFCVPDGEIEIEDGSNVVGNFVGEEIDVRAGVTAQGCPVAPPTTSTTTTSTTTSTTVPTGCGNGVVEPPEQCDPPGSPCGSPAGAFLCAGDCSCSVPTSTTTTSTTTSTTVPTGCGNGVVEPPEQCDPPGSPCGSPAGAFLCAGDCSCSVPTSTTTTTVPGVAAEVCGDCQDNDGDGDTDFEDPACCQQLQPFDMTLNLGRIRPQSTTTSRLRLRSMLARSGLADINPLREDVFLQIRSAGGTDVLCAHFPAKMFKYRRGAFMFGDRRHTVAVARSVDGVIIKVRGDGSVDFRTNSRQAKLIAPQSSNLQVTVGIRDASVGDAANRCWTMTQSFRTGRRGALLMP